MLLKCPPALYYFIPVDSESCLSGFQIIANLLYWNFISLSVGLIVSRSISSEYLLVFPTTSVSYIGVQDIGGVGASRGDGIGENIFLWLGGDEVRGYWLGRGVEGEDGGCAISVFGEGGGTGGGVGAFTITFIEYLKSLLSREARCALNFNETYWYNVGTMRAMFCTRVLFLGWRTPPTCHLLLHHSVGNFFRSCLLG